MFCSLSCRLSFIFLIHAFFIYFSLSLLLYIELSPVLFSFFFLNAFFYIQFLVLSNHLSQRNLYLSCITYSAIFRVLHLLSYFFLPFFSPLSVPSNYVFISLFLSSNYLIILHSPFSAFSRALFLSLSLSLSLLPTF